MVNVGRHPWRWTHPVPQLREGPLDPVTQDCVQMGFEYLQGRRLYSLSMQPVPVLCHPHIKEFLPHVWVERHVMVSVASHHTHVTSCTWWPSAVFIRKFWLRLLSEVRVCWCVCCVWVCFAMHLNPCIRVRYKKINGRKLLLPLPNEVCMCSGKLSSSSLSVHLLNPQQSASFHCRSCFIISRLWAFPFAWRSWFFFH